MKPSLVKKALKECLIAEDNTLVPILLGQPGAGKTTLVYDVAKELGLEVIVFRPVTKQVEDLTGLPDFMTEEGERLTHFCTPSWLPKKGTKGIFFIDEFYQAGKTMQNALSQPLLERVIGEYQFPEGWRMVAASNRAKDRAGINRPDSHIANRLVQLEMDVDLEDSVNWCLDNGVDEVIPAFMKFRPACLESFDPKLEINCTARSLVRSAAFLNCDSDIRFELVKGCIGDGWAAELLAFNRIWTELPSVEEVEKEPTKAKVSDKPDVQFAISLALAFQASVKNIKKFMTYMNRLPKEHQVAFVSQAVKLDDDLICDENILKFIDENGVLLS